MLQMQPKQIMVKDPLRLINFVVLMGFLTYWNAEQAETISSEQSKLNGQVGHFETWEAVTNRSALRKQQGATAAVAGNARGLSGGNDLENMTVESAPIALRNEK